MNRRSFLSALVAPLLAPLALKAAPAPKIISVPSYPTGWSNASYPKWHSCGGKLIVSFSRNPKVFGVKRYVQLVKVPVYDDKGLAYNKITITANKGVECMAEWRAT